MTFAQVVKALRKRFKVDLYTENLDRDVAENVRVADKNYAIRVRERQEADEELKNTSANQLKKRNINCITLLERLVYGFKYFNETSEHLDIENITLCVGSRAAGGGVPRADWGGGRFKVDWYSPGDALSSLRARQVVSC